jgi:hypothetical protein
MSRFAVRLDREARRPSGRGQGTTKTAIPKTFLRRYLIDVDR